MLAVIDADAITYFCSKETLEESKERVDSIISDIIDKTGSTHCYLFLSEGVYFRHSISPEYKAKRKEKETTLLWIKELKEYLVTQYKAVTIPLLEADDLVAYVMSNEVPGFPDKIMCSPDKDVLKQVVGRGYNYQKLEFVNTTQLDAFQFLCIQSMQGDASDNIMGIPGVGEAKANKVLKELDMSLEDVMPIILQQYIKHYETAHKAIYEFQKNFRLVYLLRKQEDFLVELGYIPELPPPNKII
jgi:5'-3' exonuclease